MLNVQPDHKVGFTCQVNEANLEGIQESLHPPIDSLGRSQLQCPVLYSSSRKSRFQHVSITILSTHLQSTKTQLWRSSVQLSTGRNYRVESASDDSDVEQ